MKRLNRFRILVLLLAAVLILEMNVTSVFAESYCTIDDYGCWVPGDDGGKMYIMFWTEAARQFFMGDSTAPYKDVVDYCADCHGRMKMDPAPVPEKPGLVIKFRTAKEEINTYYPDGMAILKGIVAFADYRDIADINAIDSVYSEDLGQLEIDGTLTMIPLLTTSNFDKLDAIYSAMPIVDAYAAINAGQAVRVKLVTGVYSGLDFEYQGLDFPHYFPITPDELGKIGAFSPVPVYAELTDGGKDEYGLEYYTGVWDEKKTKEIFAPISWQ